MFLRFSRDSWFRPRHQRWRNPSEILPIGLAPLGLPHILLDGLADQRTRAHDVIFILILLLVEPIPDRSHGHDHRKVIEFIILLSLEHLEHVLKLIVLLFKLYESDLLGSLAGGYSLLDGGLFLARGGGFLHEALSKTQLAFHASSFKYYEKLIRLASDKSMDFIGRLKASICPTIYQL